MKIAIEQLDSHLQKKLLPLYLISGDEVLLIQDAVSSIRQAAFQAGFQDRKSMQVDNNFNWEDFALETNNFSLFSQQSLLELRFLDNKFNDTAKQALEAYTQHPPTDKILLISTPKLDSKSQNETWFKQLENHGAIVTVWPIDITQLPRWILQRLQRAGLAADAKAIQLLAENTEGNLLAAQQVIEKLSLLYGSGDIDFEQMATAITDNSRFDIFNLVDSLLQGDAKRVIRILTSLQEEGVEPTLILWSITRELRSLNEMANALSLGKSLEQILMQYKVWEKRKPIIKRALQRHTFKQLMTLLQDAAAIDRMIKGANNGNVWDNLLQLGLKISGINYLEADCEIH